MKKIYPLLLFSFIMSCTVNDESPVNNELKEITNEIISSELQAVLDSAHVKGAILIYDLNMDKYYSNDFPRTKTGNLPASTFKITNSMIGLETGVIEHDSTIFKWDGEERRLKIWEQDLTFRQAFHYSCVPCYQEVAKKIGVDRMNSLLNKLDYGQMKVDDSSLTNFWLEGDSKINQVQQIDFLKRFFLSELSISERTEHIMKDLMVIEENEAYTLSGKTGWSIREGNNNGWFVGYLEKEENTFFFATNITPNEEFDMNMFPMIRKEITYKALEKLEIIN